MRDYIFWESEFGDKVVEVLNTDYESLLRIQQELTNQGYIIISICRGCFGDTTFMKIEKENAKENK